LVTLTLSSRAPKSGASGLRSVGEATHANRPAVVQKCHTESRREAAPPRHGPKNSKNIQASPAAVRIIVGIFGPRVRTLSHPHQKNRITVYHGSPPIAINRLSLACEGRFCEYVLLLCIVLSRRPGLLRVMPQVIRATSTDRALLLTRLAERTVAYSAIMGGRRVQMQFWRYAQEAADNTAQQRELASRNAGHGASCQGFLLGGHEEQALHIPKHVGARSCHGMTMRSCKSAEPRAP
jgi:hypothetical protein